MAIPRKLLRHPLLPSGQGRTVGGRCPRSTGLPRSKWLCAIPPGGPVGAGGSPGRCGIRSSCSWSYSPAFLGVYLSQ